jgi:DNA repair photolyase
MALNKSTGNMYEFITHTWNTVKGACYHDCSYCYMKRWGKLNPVHFDEKELKTDLGTGNFIFVGSSCDMFAEDIPEYWIQRTLLKCEHADNKYLFQTKNPKRFYQIMTDTTFLKDFVLCTTIETNRVYKDIMNKSPNPQERAELMNKCVNDLKCKTFITIEPILDFDLDEMLNLIKICLPKQVNIGADSGQNNLPEPSKEKVLELIEGLKEFTTIVNKKNLTRIIKL